MRDKNRPASWLFAVMLLLVVGCKQDNTPPPPATPPEITATGPLEQLHAPDFVLAYGGADRPLAVLGKLDKFLGAVAASGARPEMAARALQNAFRLSNTSALDLAKPIRVALVAGKSSEWVVAIGTSGRDKLVATLPASKKRHGDLWSYTLLGEKELHVDFIDDHVLIARGRDVLLKSREFMVTLLGSKVSQPLALEVPLGARHHEGLAALAKKLGSPSAKRHGGESIRALVELAAKHMRDAFRLRVTADTSRDGGLLLRAAALIKPDSPTAKLLGDRKPQGLPLLKRLPKQSVFALVAQVGSNELTQLLNAVSMRWAFGEGVALAKYKAELDRFSRATSGGFACVGHVTDDELHMALLTELRDGGEARSASRELLGMYDDAELKKRFEERGVELVFKRHAYKVGDISIATVDTRLTPEAKKTAPIGAGHKLLESLMSTHVATTDALQVVAFGAGAKKTMTAWLGDLSGGFDTVVGVQRALGQAAPNVVFLVYGSPIEVARRIRIEGKKPFAAALPDEAPPKRGMALSIGSDGAAVHLVIDVPADQARSIIQLMTMAKGLR